LEKDNRRFCREFGEEKMHGCWHDFEASRERQRDILREAEVRRLARAAGKKPRETRPWSALRLLRALDGKLREFLRPLVPTGGEIPPEDEAAVPSAGDGLVGAAFEEGVYSLRPSSVIELRREAEGYVVHEVDLLTGDDVLYLSTEEPEWAAWIWNQKTRR
jgi:hypothetical protein